MGGTLTFAPLDKLQIAALRVADRVAFHRTEDGRSYINVIKEHKPTVADPLPPRETQMEIPCDARLTDYRRDCGIQRNRPSDRWRGFAWISSAQHTPEWKTVTHLLRPGDVLRLHFTAGGWRHQRMEELSWTADNFNLEVIRGDKMLSFLLDHWIGEENNVTRMVKG